MCGEKVLQISNAVSATIEEEEKDQFDLLDKFRVTFLYLLDKFCVSSYVCVLLEDKLIKMLYCTPMYEALGRAF